MCVITGCNVEKLNACAQDTVRKVGLFGFWASFILYATFLAPNVNPEVKPRHRHTYIHTDTHAHNLASAFLDPATNMKKPAPPPTFTMPAPYLRPLSLPL